MSAYNFPVMLLDPFFLLSLPHSLPPKIEIPQPKKETYTHTQTYNALSLWWLHFEILLCLLHHECIGQFVKKRKEKGMCWTV